MNRALLGVALAALSFPLTAALTPVHADDDSISYNNTDYGTASDSESDSGSVAGADDSAYPYRGQSGYRVDGLIRRVDAAHDRLVIYGDDNRRYNVDDYNSDIILRGVDRAGETADLQRGMRVHITGTLLGVAFLEADHVRVLPPRVGSDAPEPAAYVTPAPDAIVAPPDPAPVHLIIPPTPPSDGKPITVDAVVTKVDTAAGQITLLGADDQRLTADMHGSDIILPTTAHEGELADLARGMHVHLIGTQGADGLVQADRIRVLPDLADPANAPTPAVLETPAPDSTLPQVPVDAELEQYTGILIDARDLPGIQRSMAPTIIGPGSTPLLLYPDRSHVPTPDEVQEESIVRYYHTLGTAEDGVAGAHPLILHAVAVVGSDDGVQLTAEDAALFQSLDQRLHFTRTWKVGFLIPESR